MEWYESPASIQSSSKSKKISTTRIFIESKPSSKTLFQAQSKQVSVVAQWSKNGLGIGMQSLSLWSSSSSSPSSTQSLSSQSPPQPYHHTPSNQTQASPVPHHTTLTLSATLPSPSKPELNPSSPCWPSMKRSNSYPTTPLLYPDSAYLLMSGGLSPSMA